MLALTGRCGRRRPLEAVLRTATRCMSSIAQLECELTSRQLPLCYDYLSPQPSHLLDLSLNPFVPCSATPTCSNGNGTSLRLSSVNEGRNMPIGHHLVYFPPQVLSSDLLRDGTDILHYPGPPFNRRMWAGGWVRFYGKGGPGLDGQRAVCMEGIRDVTVKGKEGEEKIFVGVERRVATVGEEEDEQAIRDRVWTKHENERGDAIVIERRNLVFMRDKTREQLELDKGSVGQTARAVKAPSEPEFCQAVIPSRALLFRFSALTFNAHSIHLDRDYARNVEGYPDMLVHGPLTLAMMLTVCQNHVSKLGKAIESIEYRNLAPLFVEQQMKICGKSKSKEDGAWDIWIEGHSGGLAVKGTIQTGVPGSLGGISN